MSKKRVFLSLPMSGYADEWVVKELTSMREHLAEDEVGVSNYICEKTEKNPSRFYFLGEAIKKLGTCDAILMHPAWRTAHGCNVEWTVAREYGIPVRYIV